MWWAGGSDQDWWVVSPTATLRYNYAELGNVHHTGHCHRGKGETNGRSLWHSGFTMLHKCLMSIKYILERAARFFFYASLNKTKVFSELFQNLFFSLRFKIYGFVLRSHWLTLKHILIFSLSSPSLLHLSKRSKCFPGEGTGLLCLRQGGRKHRKQNKLNTTANTWMQSLYSLHLILDFWNLICT